MFVCKFANFKDREIIRKQGRLLKDTNFSIRKQFPPEIDESDANCFLNYEPRVMLEREHSLPTILCILTANPCSRSNDCRRAG
ncbi:hypothetical protein DPMN_044426 [Dreissena polymorpha]|uniref:Uncharacterized protein n=1 Tax=Dreissena polymorpha TaxID=45954 RepID=A0A9D4I0I0_DREPO|nr:hypothetical protein DPMN_044426 [Dreissena polymorpha]